MKFDFTPRRWNQYDKGTGDVPAIGDLVEIAHYGEGDVMNGRQGKVVGFSTLDLQVIIMQLDYPTEYGETCITAPSATLILIG